MDELPNLEVLLDEKSWFDYWHTHVDWQGDGNLSMESRRPFLRALFRIFAKIEQRVSTWKKPHQVFVVIDEADSSQDAVYLHTPNPNKENYPCDFEGVEWGSPVPVWLSEFIDPKRHEVGQCLHNNAVSYWIRPLCQST